MVVCVSCYWWFRRQHDAHNRHRRRSWSNSRCTDRCRCHRRRPRAGLQEKVRRNLRVRNQSNFSRPIRPDLLQ